MSNIYDEKWAEIHFKKTSAKKPYRPEEKDDEFEMVDRPHVPSPPIEKEKRVCAFCGMEFDAPKGKPRNCPRCITKSPPNP